MITHTHTCQIHKLILSNEILPMINMLITCMSRMVTIYNSKMYEIVAF